MTIRDGFRLLMKRLDTLEKSVNILADRSAGETTSVSEGGGIPLAIGYRCLDCNYDRVFADLKPLGQRDLEEGNCPSCGEQSIAVVFSRRVTRRRTERAEQTPPPQPSETVSESGSGPKVDLWLAPDWVCSTCQWVNKAIRAKCRNFDCNGVRPEVYTRG